MYEFISQELVQLRFRKRPVIGGSDLWSVAEPIRGAEPVGGMAGVAQPPDRSDEMSGSVWFVVGEVEPGEADQGRAGQVWHPSEKGSPGLARQEVECFITSLECAKGDRTEDGHTARRWGEFDPIERFERGRRKVVEKIDRRQPDVGQGEDGHEAGGIP